MIYKTNKNIITVMKKIFSMVCACLLALSAQATDIKKYDALYENLPFQMEKVTRPQFPANEVNLKDFGAIGDGSSLCTTAFAKAIDALTQKGGGNLLFLQRTPVFSVSVDAALTGNCHVGKIMARDR